MLIRRFFAFTLLPLLYGCSIKDTTNYIANKQVEQFLSSPEIQKKMKEAEDRKKQEHIIQKKKEEENRKKLEKEAEQKQAKEMLKQKKEKEEKNERFVKKFGYPECESILSDAINQLFISYRPLQKDCLYELGHDFNVLEQIDAGTLAQNNGMIIFIESNEIDENSVDSTPLSNGYVRLVGKFQYTSLLKSQKTVYRFKRYSNSK